MKSISIIVPCYNYEKLIISKIQKLIAKIKSYRLNYEIIIIDDGSKDNTFFKLKKFIKKNKKIVLLKNPINKGKSYSIKKGLKVSKFNHVVLIDCDLAYFEKMNQIIKYLKKNIDFVAINRRLRKSKLINKQFTFYKFIRHFVGQFISQIIKTLLKLNIEACDTQAGLKGFKKNVSLNKTKFISERFFFDLELIFLYLKNEKKIHFIPVKYEVSDNSSIKIFDIKNFLIIVELFKVITKCKNLK